MSQFNASDMDVASVQCAVCEKGITGGNWFARIRHGDWVVALCCPLCTEVFEKNPHPYIRRIETLARGHVSGEPAASQAEDIIMRN
jgi:hypothetical protein